MQRLCLSYEIDGNVCLHREGTVLETGLLKKLRPDASKNRGLELACLENPVWENGMPTITDNFLHPQSIPNTHSESEAAGALMSAKENTNALEP